MKFRSHQGDGKIEMQMAPMIDIVFQLLIFFMLTLRIVAAEGDFNINMPLGATAPTADMPPPPQEIRVRLEANPDGSLKQIYFGDRGLGNQVPQSFNLLNDEIRRWTAEVENMDDREVELDPDFNLDFRYALKALSACKGRLVNGQQLIFVEKIKFAPIRRGGG